ncbi:unnamed protein product [Hermetia illucens]|uniref:Ig-like domain-containing protein n=1 Tax=Hermetia illucens TaxID=343691 RepID=A0A7R8YPQ2_HERIL|nr:unnamed protein product [Hermetia illucens]
MAQSVRHFTTALGVFIQLLFNIFIAAVLVQGGGHNQDTAAEVQPEFLAQLNNFSVTQGRDVSFTCIVNNLGQYRVAWIKSDTKAILAIHTHMVALNPRLSVTHNGHNTWKLHISHVQLNDSGSYMCQVNTDPMKFQSGYLSVVVPPDILDEEDVYSESPPRGANNEGGTIQLYCRATGVPSPTVQWRREDGKDIILRSESKDKRVPVAVKAVEGERLILNQVHRTDMGGYLCIASNGVPPSCSKRFDVHVNFPPTIKEVVDVMVSPVDSDVTLQCIAEVFPKPLNGWHRNETKIKIHDGSKYSISEALIRNSYTWQLNLTIRNVQKSDFGVYVCSSVNALGKREAYVSLKEFIPEKTTPIPHVYTTPKPRRKLTTQYNKSLNEVVRPKEPAISNHIPNTDFAVGLPEDYSFPNV